MGVREDGECWGRMCVSIAHLGRRVSLNTLCISYGHIHGRVFVLKIKFCIIVWNKRLYKIAGTPQKWLDRQSQRLLRGSYAI